MNNIFDNIGKCSGICITTNGFVKSNGRCVMGRGIALSARDTFKNIDLELGKLIYKHGNICQPIRFIKGTYLIAFPVKTVGEIMSEDTLLVSHHIGRFRPGDFVPGFALKADLKTIERSATQLMNMVNTYSWNKVLMTKPGCFNGGLDWDVVKPVLDTILDERVEIQ